MPLICYDEAVLAKLLKNADKLQTIKHAVTIIQQFQAQGFDLTLRQLYYQFVAGALIQNKDSEYKKLGDIVSDARMAGLIDWNAIVDRTRFLRSLDHWTAPHEIIKDCVKSYRIDRWATQSLRVEVWVEKDALVGVIGQVCERYDLPYFSCRGYTSMSEMWGAAQRLRRHIERGQRVLVLHMGDHDPSGVDMTRDIRARLRTFGLDMGGTTRVKRVALTMAQINQYNPPPNPAKLSDGRAKKYIEKYGPSSWELDALSPTILAGLIEDEVNEVRDIAAWRVIAQRQKDDRKGLQKAADHWGSVISHLDTV